MNTAPVCSPAALAARWMAVTLVAVVTLLPVLPVMAYEAPPTVTEYLARHRTPALGSEHDGAIWSLALIGPVAILLIVTVLSLTITTGSLRADLRRQLELDRYWRREAGARAARAVRRETIADSSNRRAGRRSATAMPDPATKHANSCAMPSSVKLAVGVEPVGRARP